LFVFQVHFPDTERAEWLNKVRGVISIASKEEGGGGKSEVKKNSEARI